MTDLVLLGQAMRSALGFTLLLSLILIVQVFIRHRRAYKMAPRENGLIPHTYTLMMATGVFLLEFALAWAIGQQIRESANFVEVRAMWRLGLYMVGSFLVLCALLIVRQTEARRMRAAKEQEKIRKDLGL